MIRRLSVLSLFLLLSAAGLSAPALAAEAGSTDIRIISPSSGPPAAPRRPVEGHRVTPELQTLKVGLLLPLTGRSAGLGTALQDAATVALFDKYARMSPQFASVRVELLPKDTGDTPEQAAAATRGVLEAGADLIIGPLFADATAVAAPLAAKQHISMISFSNNATQARPDVYIYGFSPQEQTMRVVTFALKKGRTRIAALVPDSALGRSVTDAANAALNSLGSKLAATARYAPQGVGIDKALDELMPNGTPNFDALLLPEGGPALPTILRALDARGVRQPKVQLLGTGIWDDVSLLRRVNLDGAWLASSPPASTALFEKRFTATYGYQPPRIASLAYDAVSLAVTLATGGHAFDAEALTNPTGFTGPANGNFRFHPDGKVERSLAVLQVSGTNFTVVDMAPLTFTSTAAAQ